MSVKQKDLVQGRITNGTLMRNIADGLRKDLDKLRDTMLGRAQKYCGGVLASIRSDLEMVLAEPPEPMTNEQTQALREADAELKRMKLRYDEVLKQMESMV
jgi:hypothetical protein